MEIQHFTYNAFTIAEGNTRIAIDPGQNLWMFKKNSLIPESEWHNVTHIMVTHGDPDHFKYAVAMARETKAAVICGDQLREDFSSAGITATHSISAGQTISMNGLKVSGVKAIHGPLPVKMLGGLISVTGKVRDNDTGGQEVYLAGIQVQKIQKPMEVYSHGTVKLLGGLIRLEMDNIDFARGSVGYLIELNGKSVLNLGDSVLLDEWTGLSPDVLMIPIGGGIIPNTMNITDALEAVSQISPKLVIPCHYNVPYGTKKNCNPTDEKLFRNEVINMGVDCTIMAYGDKINF